MGLSSFFTLAPLIHLPGTHVILWKQRNKIKREMEVARRRGRRRKKLLDDLKNRRGYSHLKEKALDRTMWRNRFGGGFGPVVRQNTEWMIEWNEIDYNTILCTVIRTLSLYGKNFFIGPVYLIIFYGNNTLYLNIYFFFSFYIHKFLYTKFFL